MVASSIATRLKRLAAFDNWPELLVQRTLFRRTALQVHRKGDLHILVDHRASDVGSIRACIAGPMYASFLSSLSLPASPVVLDLGANVGGFSLLLHLRGVRFARLVCVEMNPRTCERLRFNILGNDLPSAAVLNAAVCATPRSLTLRLGRGSTGDSIYRTAGRPDTAQSDTHDHTIPGMSLDEICASTIGPGVIDLCKMDIEGAEDEVLLAPDSENASLSRIRYLLTELHNADTLHRNLGRLFERGFERVPGSADAGGCGVHLFHNARLAEPHRTLTITIPQAAPSIAAATAGSRALGAPLPR